MIEVKHLDDNGISGISSMMMPVLLLYAVVVVVMAATLLSEHSRIFSGNNTHTDYFKTLLRDGNNILIGARNAVYNISLADLSENQRLEWHSTDADYKMCLVKGKDEVRC
ncbi:semaphorin-1A-like [Rhopalosiphum maidis]|uniref:semaphorin-1A-like n=1 Tax=Rhopalosiphum maidis TaxID=43146 RepID=UPI000EFEFDFE|nr:semaphorin-1A-like [Rhopalosiphum maidis]